MERDLPVWHEWDLARERLAKCEDDWWAAPLDEQKLAAYRTSLALVGYLASEVRAVALAMQREAKAE